ncbi:UNVERIFIED_ORG: hypothetical protein GGI57_003034 [Rhizobium aethiopicum]
MAPRADRKRKVRNRFLIVDAQKEASATSDLAALATIKDIAPK